MTQALEVMLIMLRVAKVYQVFNNEKVKAINRFRDVLLLRKGLKKKKSK